MNRYRFSYNPIFSEPAHRTGLRPGQLVWVLNALLLVLGSLALASTFASTTPSLLSTTRALKSISASVTKSTGPLQITPVQVTPARPVHIVPHPPLNTLLFHGNPRLSEVALTFDDGPQPSSTLQILSILHYFHIKATFFCIGQLVQVYPTVVRQEYIDGDLVEDHSWSHPNLSYLSASAIHTQLAMGARAIYQVTSTQPTFFRPPYGSTTPIVVSQALQLGLSTVLWTIDPRDWSLPGSQAIALRVLNAVTNGSIILLHDGGGNRSETVAALPTIILMLQKRGFHFVTLQQMVEDL